MEPTVRFKGGGSFVVKSPLFSSDGQMVFVVWRNVIVCYNTKTSKRLRELSGLQDPIVGFEVHFVNNCEHVTACSSSGEVIAWNVEMGLRVSRMKLSGINLCIESFNLITPINDDNEENVKFLLSWTGDNDGGRKIIFGYYSVKNNKRQAIDLRLNKKKYWVAVNRSDNPFFVAVQGKSLYFSKLTGHRQIHRHNIEASKHFTCVACHPEEECVITGDNLGRVILWYNLINPQNTTRAVFHWHTLPVRSLSFSSSGTNFYSGAAECVLVRWYLDNPHHKEFLPRLPSTIEHIKISNGNRFIAVATADNAVRVIDHRFESISIIQHLVLSTHFPAGIVYDQRTKSIVLNGLVGHVQFYSPNDMTLLYNLDIVGHNKLTQERDCHIENTNVTAIAIHNCGLWLATVEERVDTSFSFELRLKFWAFNTVKQQFELNTSIELPHEKSITQLLFQPSYNDKQFKCLTVGNDKKFKIWQLVNADTIYHKGNAWSCSRVGFYRDLFCNAAAFSSDGSLLAVSFGPTVTAWLPNTCELKCSLLHPTYKDRITILQFGTGNQCHLLVAATSEQLSVWNLLSLSMVWTVRLPVSLVIASPFVSHMAVFTTDDRLFIFSPDSSQYLYTCLLENENENVSAAVIVPSNTNSDMNMNWYQGSQLFFINKKQELFCLDADEDSYNDAVDILSDNFSSSLFTSTLPQNRLIATQKVNPVQHMTKIFNNNKQLKKLLDAPVHTMIPIRLTCESILRSVISEHKLPTKSSQVS